LPSEDGIDGLMTPPPLPAQLLEPLAGRVLIAGVGNPMRGDDGAGPAVIDKIRDRVGVPCIDCGVAPENYLGKILHVKPDTLLFIDIVHFHGSTGEVRLFSDADIGSGDLATHGLSLTVSCEYLKANMPVRIFVLGIEPGNTGLDTPMSAPVSRAVQDIASLLIGRFGHA
jgi:hydrogenase 3 maturation protease